MPGGITATKLQMLINIRRGLTEKDAPPNSQYVSIAKL